MTKDQISGTTSGRARDHAHLVRLERDLHAHFAAHRLVLERLQPGGGYYSARRRRQRSGRRIVGEVAVVSTGRQAGCQSAYVL